MSSFFQEPPSELAFVDLAPPRPTMAIDAVWAGDADDPPPAVGLLLDAAATLGADRGWQ